MDSSTEHDPHVNVTNDSIPRNLDRGEIVTDMDRPPLLSWGAVFAGLVFVISISWLLYLLGMALGVSIADATDGEVIGNGLTTGAIIWMVVSALIAYFLGSMLTARLSGKLDVTVGMLHGMTVWALATTLTVFLSYLGVSSLLQTGYSLVSGTASTAISATSSIASGISSTGSMIGNAVMSESDSQLVSNIQARIKRRAAALASKVASTNGADVSSADIKQAIESLSTDDMLEIAQTMVMGDMTAARESLADKTSLSNAEVKSVIDGIANEFEEQLGTAENNTNLATDISNTLKRQAADMIAELDSAGGVDVNKKEVRQALNQMSPQVMQTVAMRLMRGDVKGAKDVVTANTNLSTKEINALVDGVNDDVARTVDKYQATANAALESATDYTQAVLWTVFAASAMGLAISLLGGWLGTEGSRRVHFEVRRNVV